MGIFSRDHKADFSDVRGGSSTTDPVSGTPAPSRRTYTVKEGDTLSGIAKRFYGRPTDWRRIYEANEESIKSPDLIFPGQTFTIPE